MSHSVPALEARGLVKSYRRGRAVDGVDVVIGRGERVAILGPNGAGKTTTLLMCLGAVSPDRGTTAICGHLLPRRKRHALAHVGFAAGYLPMPERLRVREYLRIYGLLYGLRDTGEHVRRALIAFGIANLADAMATELSSGQKTLVGIVKATLHVPQLVVLDEPTASLDPNVAARVRTGLTKICGPGRAALLLTSHDMQEVEQLADRVIFLVGGRIVAQGPPADVAARFGSENLEQVFLELARSGKHHDEVPS
jgi:ABC-2 type transport system ATP-binding protein